MGVSPMDSRAGRSCHAMVTRRISEEPTAIPRLRVGLPLKQRAVWRRTKHCRRLLCSKSRLRDGSRLRDDGKVCGPRLNKRCGTDHSVQVFAGFHASLYRCDKGAAS
jgi:hypothetical protein